MADPAIGEVAVDDDCDVVVYARGSGCEMLAPEVESCGALGRSGLFKSLESMSCENDCRSRNIKS